MSSCGTIPISYTKIDSLRRVGRSAARQPPDSTALHGCSTRSVATAKKPEKKGAGKKADPNERVVAQNRKARHDYTILETLECGIALVGSEVKSMRTGQVSLNEAYGRIRDNEVWLLGCDIPEYTEANRYNHVPRRPRKLLLHRREIRRFAAHALQQGLTLVPLKVYFKEGKAKVLMGICRGRQKHDKREDLKRTQARREIRQHLERRR